MTRFLNVLLAAMLLPVATFAADLKFAVVDTTYVFANTSAAELARSELKDQTESAQSFITKMEEQLREEEARLLEKKKTLSTEKFAEEEAVFRQAYQEYRRKSQELQSKLTHQSMTKKQEIMLEIKNAVEAIAIKRNFDLVLPRTGVMYSTESVDISKDVLKKVNSMLKEKGL